MTKTVKIIYIFCFCLLFSSIIIANNSSAPNYEASIYKSTPIIVWVFIVVSLIIGIFCSIHFIYEGQESQKFLLYTSLLIVYFVYIFCLSLFIIKGYYMWRISADPATHLGYAKQILDNGHIVNVFYPLTHIYITQLALILNVDLIALHKIIPLFFDVLYVPFMYVFASSVLQNKNQAILATIASMTFINGWHSDFTPNALANHFLPIILYIVVKTFSNQNIIWKIVTLIMVFFYPLFHPIPNIVFILLISMSIISGDLTNLWNKYFLHDNESTKSKLPTGLTYTILILIIVWSITWFSSFYIWKSTINNINILITETSSTNLDMLSSQVENIQDYGYSVYELMLKITGPVFVYVFMAVVSFFVIWNKKEKNQFLLFFYLLLIGISISIAFLFMLNLHFSPQRLVTYITLICTVYVGYLLNHIVNNARLSNKKMCHQWKILGVIFLLIGLFISGLLIIYPSSYILTTNYQTTEKEVIGMQRLFDFRNPDLEITGISIRPNRFADFLLTPTNKRALNIKWSYDNGIVPYHFNYVNNSTLSEYYSKNMYLGIMNKDKLKYSEVLPKIANDTWNINDFNKLQSDEGLFYVFSNGEFDIYYIQAKKDD